VTATPCTPQLGTLYTLDADGNVTSQQPDTGAAYSWTEQWYDSATSGVSQLELRALELGTS
jgi:hypothetical protein